eukprot:830087_1
MEPLSQPPLDAHSPISRIQSGRRSIHSQRVQYVVYHQDTSDRIPQTQTNRSHYHIHMIHSFHCRTLVTYKEHTKGKYLLSFSHTVYVYKNKQAELATTDSPSRMNQIVPITFKSGCSFGAFLSISQYQRKQRQKEIEMDQQHWKQSAI